jgi:hypothetical protein
MDTTSPTDRHNASPSHGTPSTNVNIPLTDVYDLYLPTDTALTYRWTRHCPPTDTTLPRYTIPHPPTHMSHAYRRIQTSSTMDTTSLTDGGHDSFPRLDTPPTNIYDLHLLMDTTLPTDDTTPHPPTDTTLAFQRAPPSSTDGFDASPRHDNPPTNA